MKIRLGARSAGTAGRDKRKGAGRPASRAADSRAARAARPARMWSLLLPPDSRTPRR